MMSLKERALHLRLTANSFIDYPNTAKWINYLADTILVPKPTWGEADVALREIIGAFRVEYIGSGANAKYRERCYNEYTTLFFELMKNGLAYDTFQALLPALKSGSQALGNIREVYQTLVASEELSDKRKYFGLCFMYLIFIEGLFDEDIRIIYTVKKACESIKVEYKEIKDKSIGEFKKELADVFFEGHSRRLRNAIAHARFCFDDKTKKMNFSDYDPKTKSAWSEDLTLQEFGEKY